MSMWNSAKAKVQLRLSVQRLRTLQQKKEAQAKASRRDIATLLERGKIETARVKVETIINEDIHIELLELLELYCELLIARFGLLDQSTRVPDPGISEGVCSIIHAAPRTELKGEQEKYRPNLELLMHKYGRDFSAAVMENRDNCVSERVVKKLVIATPSSQLVDAYLTEIAKAYGVSWRPPGQEDDHEGGDDGGVKVGDSYIENALCPLMSIVAQVEKDIKEETDTPETDTASLKLPSVSNSRPKSQPAPSQEEDEYDALAKRFAALKKR
ncbi:hypothetical protein CC1G_00497 [Coprinopsis cinerea okayama7|uniref:DUF292 domain-containing protein n=1 Tax=Coprinopsis cinerea (strain Okayama-7 / 130 / ATCC MYA-4618 / FGSC 9003) TaxID=240176 RepID=A8N373_COPC7|nr:hypothetical protein CC1G_00497 [Coprinopsis cinerea okayama7\|eukprot:XP_001829318.2 hypothetical protein CC1G_00497 [Coprinopsis cinerea okayama7\